MFQVLKKAVDFFSGTVNEDAEFSSARLLGVDFLSRTCDELQRMLVAHIL
jgi:hypothetical protein